MVTVSTIFGQGGVRSLSSFRKSVHGQKGVYLNIYTVARVSSKAKIYYVRYDYRREAGQVSIVRSACVTGGGQTNQAYRGSIAVDISPRWPSLTTGASISRSDSNPERPKYIDYIYPSFMLCRNKKYQLFKRSWCKRSKRKTEWRYEARA